MARRRARRAVAAGLAGVTAYDLVQRRHAVLRNFPVVGHLRYLLELFGPELRQYIVTSNDEERPFNRDQRRWVYASAKRQPSTFGFGTDNEMESVSGMLAIKHAAFPVAPAKDGAPGGFPHYAIPAGKVLGGARGRRHAFRPPSLVNVSGMSFGALSGPAVQALNDGCRIAGCLHGTGEGGLSPHHCHGGELVFQIGTGYFGCRDAQGRFSLEHLQETIARAPVRAIEIKLSQGAKPGLGGLLPAAKVTPEIAAIRGVEAGRDCVSPPGHSAFGSADELLDFCEAIAEATGLPVGIKSAVGEQAFWDELAALMAAGGRGVDFVVIDGGEGGTGAAPLAFTDHVALPFKLGFARVYAAFARAGIAEDVVLVGSGKLGFPDAALFALALGCDMVNVGREAMMAVGCIQAQRCHTGRCPTGVATQSPWLTRGLDPELKAVRHATYVRALRGELLALARTCGVVHPALVAPDRLEIVSERFASTPLHEVFGYEPGWATPPPARRAEIEALMSERPDWRGPGPELGPVPGDGTGGDISVGGSPAQPPRLPPLSS
ncbi:MAG TPA: FMN-binding glutamate synthase family protein [Conexibacter sp.]|jgi:glutamate synthase domain-containing protein 2|nr:FMN-binding glutamate synthase family protein [Conexibacter sp.]